jgi:hypothetical protein
MLRLVKFITAAALGLALGACILALGACGHLAGQPEPVSVDSFFAAIPGDMEMTAVIEVQHDAIRTAYLLAISTGAEPRLSLLSPQGIPLFQAYPQGTRVAVEKQAGLPSPVSPRALLSYLLMTYGETSALRAKALSPGYAMLADTQRREYKSLHDTRSRVVVEFRGSAPWYDSAAITDSGTGLVILMTTLETRYVQPR